MLYNFKFDSISNLEQYMNYGPYVCVLFIDNVDYTRKMYGFMLRNTLGDDDRFLYILEKYDRVWWIPKLNKWIKA